MAASDESPRNAPDAEFPLLGGPLDPINAAFHESYDQARDAAEREGPVLVLLGDELTLLRGGNDAPPRVFSATSRVFHALKVVAHVPVAAFTLLHARRGAPTDPAALARLRNLVSAALTTLAVDVPDAEAQEECRLVLERSQALLDEVHSVTPAVANERSAAFARAMGDHLRELIDHATREQLAALDAAFAAVLAVSSADERATLHVVVAGAHQARDRSLAMQYFARRLADRPDGEERVTYAEAVTTVEAAAQLIGTQRFDKVLAAAFFGDAERLQRDLLGDAAQRILDEAPGQT